MLTLRYLKNYDLKHLITMSLLIILLIVFVIILIVRSSSKKQKDGNKTVSNPVEIKIEYPNNKKVKGKVLPNPDGSITLCRENESRVTLLGITQEVANEIVDICDEFPSIYESERRVGMILMENEVQVKEVEEFRSKVRPVVERRVNKLIAKYPEWESLGEKDKEDVLEEFTNESMVEFDDEVSPAMSVSLSYLTFKDPITVPRLNEIISEYGSDNTSTYCEHFGRKNPIIKISNVNYRKPLEDLVDIGLAYSGKDMSVEELLSTFTLAELNEIASTDKKFTRKEKAIQFVAEKEDVTSIIEKHIALRSLFVLNPLPDKFKEFDVEKFIECKDYYKELACVLISLYDGLSTMDYK